LRWYDGGATLRALRVLGDAQPHRIHQVTLDRFAHDVEADRYLLGSTVQQLEDMVEIFGLTPADVADVILPYVSNLFGFATPTESPTRNEIDPFANTAVALLSKPYRLGLLAVQRFVMKLLALDEIATVDDLCRSIDDVEVACRVAPALVASSDAAQLGSETVNVAREWAIGENVSLRLAAARILNGVGETVPEPPAQQLPATYSIVVPSPTAALQHDGPLPSVSDDLDFWVLNDRRPLQRLAMASQLDVERVYARAQALCAQELPGLPRDAVYRTRYGALGWVYHTPASRAWDRVRARMASELSDAGRGEPEFLAHAAGVWPAFDHELLKRTPSARPLAVRPVAVPERRMYDDEAWGALPDEPVSLLASEHDGWTVVAEYSTLRVLGHEPGEEVRTQSLCLQDAPLLPAELTGAPLSTLSTLGSTPEEEMVILHEDSRMLSPSLWLALAPDVTEACGWTQADSTPSWNDAEGPVTRCVWWTDGWIAANQWGSDSSEVGEGWLITVAPRGLVALEGALGSSQIAWHVSRSRFSRRPLASESGTRPIGQIDSTNRT
jgi:hypothetical protein